ncbi:MAG: hypothetical protein PUB99_03955 [Oscillospiraceae bacterium]|nr:hypothetical protein [Oscillospiraceae bacterium]
MKKALSFLLAALFVFGCACPVFAEDSAETGSFTLVNYNVDGLPIPKSLSSTGRDPAAASKQIGAKLKQLNADIYAVQEDFNYHPTIKKGLDADYTTLHNGAVPFGDGLNFFSRFPLYNVHRETWNEACGVFTDGSDELTPKGFLCSSFALADGVYLDIYVLHADAYSGEGNTAARLSQYEQLMTYVNRYSAGHAVILTGDFNSYFSQPQNKLREIFVEREGFKEAWIEINYQGNYNTGTLPHPDYHKPEWADNGRWGVWDSAEKMFYRDADGVSLQALQCDYIRIEDENGQSLSDHNAQIGVFQFTVDRSALRDTRTYNAERFRPLRTAYRRMKYLFKALGLILRDLPKVISGEIKIEIK